MKVEQLMTRPVWTCGPEESLQVAAQLMWEHDVGCVVVQHGGQIFGVITDRDICMGDYTTGQASHEVRVGRRESPPRLPFSARRAEPEPWP